MEVTKSHYEFKDLSSLFDDSLLASEDICVSSDEAVVGYPKVFCVHFPTETEESEPWMVINLSRFDPTPTE